MSVEGLCGNMHTPSYRLGLETLLLNCQQQGWQTKPSPPCSQSNLWTTLRTGCINSLQTATARSVSPLPFHLRSALLPNRQYKLTALFQTSLAAGSCCMEGKQRLCSGSILPHHGQQQNIQLDPRGTKPTGTLPLPLKILLSCFRCVPGCGCSLGANVKATIACGAPYTWHL